MASLYSDLKVRSKISIFTLSDSIEETNNIINEKNGGYDNVVEYIPIGQPNAATLSKIDVIEPSEFSGDRMFPPMSWFKYILSLVLQQSTPLLLALKLKQNTLPPRRPGHARLLLSPMARTLSK